FNKLQLVLISGIHISHTDEIFVFSEFIDKGLQRILMLAFLPGNMGRNDRNNLVSYRQISQDGVIITVPLDLPNIRQIVIGYYAIVYPLIGFSKISILVKWFQSDEENTYNVSLPPSTVRSNLKITSDRYSLVETAKVPFISSALCLSHDTPIHIIDSPRIDFRAILFCLRIIFTSFFSMIFSFLRVDQTQ